MGSSIIKTQQILTRDRRCIDFEIPRYGPDCGNCGNRRFSNVRGAILLDSRNGCRRDESGTCTAVVTHAIYLDLYWASVAGDVQTNLPPLLDQECSCSTVFAACLLLWLCSPPLYSGGMPFAQSEFPTFAFSHLAHPGPGVPLAWISNHGFGVSKCWWHQEKRGNEENCRTYSRNSCQSGPSHENSTVNF